MNVRAGKKIMFLWSEITGRAGFGGKAPRFSSDEESKREETITAACSGSIVLVTDEMKSTRRRENGG